MPRARLLAIPFLLAGCTVGPDHEPPAARAPEAWPEPLEGAIAHPAPDLAAWWRGFADPTLDSLVDRALAGSLDLRAATARVREARALRGISAADRLPAVDLSGSASAQRSSANSGGGPGGPPGQESELYEVGFDATWEIDVFGRVRRSIEAADAEVGASVEDLRDARIVLIAEVARSYIELRAAQARLGFALDNVQTQQETLDLSRDRLRAGIASELDVARSLAQLESSRSQIPPLIAAMRRFAFRLDILLGVPPGTLAAELEPGAPIPTMRDAIATGLPAELLRRRPDIRRAERELAAATARIGVAEADLYPRFTLSGSFGLESSEVENLFEGDSRTWSAGPLAVRWPIFDAGRIRSNIHVQEARQELALIAYERAVLDAHEEVANALVELARVQDRRESLARAAEADRLAVRLANDLWTRGLTDFLNVLETQRALFQLEDQLAASEAEVSTSIVALYKALGGGWDDSEFRVGSAAP